MAKDREICFSRFQNNSASERIFNLFENPIVSLTKTFKRKELLISCLEVSSYNAKKLSELSKQCENAAVILSMDGLDTEKKSFDLNSTVKSKAVHLFYSLTCCLEKSDSISMPYYDDARMEQNSQYSTRHPDDVSFQLSRALLQFFLMKNFEIDDQKILEKHTNWFNRPGGLRPQVFSKLKYNKELIAINAISTHQNYFLNTTEAAACLHTYDNNIPFYIGFSPSAFSRVNSLATMLPVLLSHCCRRRQEECVIVLRNDQYEDPIERLTIELFIDKIYETKFNFAFLHVFLLTKDVDDPLSNAYPDYSQFKSSSSQPWIPLLNNAGYYLSDPDLFQIMLKKKRYLYTSRKSQELYFSDDKFSPVAETQELKQLTEVKEDFFSGQTRRTKRTTLGPAITYVMQTQAETKQELQAEEAVHVTETVTQQQQLTALQEQKQNSMQKQSLNYQFCPGLIFHMDFDSFVDTLTKQLITRQEKNTEKREKFKLYFADPEKIDDLWGLGTPAVAAKKIAGKLFGIGYQEREGKDVIIRTSSSIDYIDTWSSTHKEILSHIELYRDGVSFLACDDNNRFFQTPMTLFETFNGRKELKIKKYSSISYSDSIFKDSLALSTLPLEAKSEEAKKAYYQLFNGQLLSKKRSEYSDRLMAVFWDELPCSSRQEQESCLNDYCALYHEYDDSESGEKRIRALFKESKNVKADLKRLLYVHAKGDRFFVRALIDLFKKLEEYELSVLFYKIYFEKSDDVSSLFYFLKDKSGDLYFPYYLYRSEQLFARLPPKKNWLPYHRFLASFLLSFPLRLPGIEPTTFWIKIEALAQIYAKDKEEQQKILLLFVDVLASEEGLRIQGGCHPQIVFAALTKILSSAGTHSTFYEQIEMLADLPMAWCDALYAIQEQGFRVVCREMKLETAYFNPVKEGEILSNGYKVSRADFQKALTLSSTSDVFPSLKIVLFRYLGVEVRRENLGYYRLLFENTHSFNNSVLKERVIGWFVFYTTGLFYTEEKQEKSADIKKHFSATEQEEVEQLLKQLQEINFSTRDNVTRQNYQLKGLLERVKPVNFSEFSSVACKRLIITVIDKRLLNSFLQTHQHLLQTNGITFQWIGSAFIEEALEEEPFFKNDLYKNQQRALLQTFLTRLDPNDWVVARESIRTLLNDMTDFLKFFTEHSSYRSTQAEILYEGLKQLVDDQAALHTVIAIFLQSQYEEAYIDFSKLHLFFDSLNSSSSELKKNKALLGRIAKLILSANPPSLQQVKLYMQLADHLIRLSVSTHYFDEIIRISENTEVEDWLKLCCQLDSSLLSPAITLFHVVQNHKDTLNFLKKIMITHQVTSLVEWINKLKLSEPNQRIFIFEIINALMQKENENPLDWIQWTILLRNLSLAELSALTQLSKENQFSISDIHTLIQSNEIINTKNRLERQQLKPLSATLLATPEHTLEKINEIQYKPSNGHAATALEYSERQALWRDYQTLCSFVVNSTRAVFVEQSSTGLGQVRSLTELTEAEIQILVRRIQIELTATSTPYFRRHDLEIILMAVASVAMYRVIDRFPRDVQLLAVLNSMNRSGNVIHQIETGEGKGITAALHAILIWSRGRIADIVTINDKLAERDRKQFNPVYQYLGIPCSTEIISRETAPEICQEHGIYYGLWSSFFLLRIQMGIKGLAWFENRSMVCDELDAIINTSVESRLATFIDTLFQGKEKWEHLYNYLLDFVIKKNKPFNLAECRQYLVRRTAEEQFKNSTTVSLPQLDDVLLTELLDIAPLAHTFKEKINYSVVEKSVRKGRKVEKYLYAAPTLDSTKRPDADISWHWLQQFLHTQLNRTPNLPFPFEIETHAETVMTGSVKNFFDSYQQSGGTVYGLTGTVGSPADVQRFFAQNKCIAFEHPRYAPDLRKGYGVEGARGKDAPFALILEKLTTFSNKLEVEGDGFPPFLNVFSSAKEVDDFYSYIQMHNPDLLIRVQRYDGVDREGALSIENIIEKAGKANTITLTTESLARGADINAQHPEGLFVINSCTALTESDLEQILGRTARGGKKGHCISLINLDHLIPQRENETLEAWFSRHRNNFSNQQFELREQRRPVQEIRYAVTNRLLNLNIELMSVLIPQEGILSRARDDKTFLKTLSQLDQCVESKNNTLLEDKENKASSNEELIQFAVAHYQESLNTLLRHHHLDDYPILELPIPLEEIPHFSELLNDITLGDLAILSDALSSLWKLIGNQAIEQVFNIAEIATLQLDLYLKGNLSLQSLLIGQAFNMNFITAPQIIALLNKAQEKIPAVLENISDFKVFDHSVLLGNEEEKKEIETELISYTNNIKQCVEDKNWDEIKPPPSDEGIVKKYLNRFKTITSFVKGASVVTKITQFLLFPYPTIMSESTKLFIQQALPEGSTQAVVLFFLKAFVTHLIKKQNSSSGGIEKQLALLAAGEAILLSVTAAFRKSYSLETPLNTCLESIQSLFKTSISDLLDKDKSNENKSSKDQPNIVNGLLTFLKEKSILQNSFLEYLIQILPIVLSLLTTPYIPSSHSHQASKTYGELSLREFFTVEVLFSFFKLLIKSPSFLHLLETHPRILNILNLLSEVSLNSFQQLKKITLADNKLINFIKIISHPRFSSFLAILPKNANWKTMSAWLNYKEEKQAPLPPENIQAAVDKLHAYQKERLVIEAATREKLHSLRERFTLSPEKLKKEFQVLHKLPACPETLDAKPFTAYSPVRAEIIAPVVYPHLEEKSEIKEINSILAREQAPSFPDIKDWLIHASPPAAYLSAAMAYITKTGEARSFITEAMRQVAAVISDEKMMVGEQFNYIENIASAIKQWQIIDATHPAKVDYLHVMKPALLTCMKNYRNCSNKSIDRYLLINELITKTQKVDTSETLLNLLASTKQQLLETDRKVDAFFLYSFWGWRRNSKGSSRLLEQLDNMIAAVTVIMIAEGKAATAETCIENANTAMLRSLIQREKDGSELHTKLTTVLKNQGAYHPPLVTTQLYFQEQKYATHMAAFYNSFNRSETFRQAMRFKESEPLRLNH